MRGGRQLCDEKVVLSPGPLSAMLPWSGLGIAKANGPDLAESCVIDELMGRFP